VLLVAVLPSCVVLLRARVHHSIYESAIFVMSLALYEMFLHSSISAVVVMWHVHYATSRFLINDGSSVWAIWTFILYFTVMWAPSDPCMYYQASKLRLVASQRKPLILLLFFACKIFPRAPSVHLLVLLYKCFPSVISKLTISSSCKMKKKSSYLQGP
jgi:hypothetical protein